MDYTRGIALACSLSPLLGGFYLHRLDVAMTRPDLFYLRYMDDVLVLAATRNKLRQGICVVNRLFEELELQKHPDKTQLGLSSGASLSWESVTPSNSLLG
ncbi:hypothetical protein C2E19_17620 [Pseudomonas sp. DTU12.3]|uniref:reverse transcriptase domain-containing protein n=1 Tax=Pseudomonas sp. DTU12.3 TaxID=2073078 RepID=UPI0010130FCD|nr:reverse transcriptase domain-containing protein [Pseudomonas sp. DTU12.3]QAX85555.1 hypothetical protein C2E19_17620 [Pseudomonas sp. DTU12.3]